MNIFKFQFLYCLGRNIPDLATKRLPRIKSNYLLKNATIHAKVQRVGMFWF